MYRPGGKTTQEEIDAARAETGETGGGGKLMGETWYWDEFVVVNNRTGEYLTWRYNGNFVVTGKIYLDWSWGSVIDTYAGDATTNFAWQLADKYRSKKFFDLKSNPMFSDQGRMFGGRYAHVRSMGNHLAGLNASNAGATWTQFVRAAGAVHLGKGRTGAIRAFYFGKEYAPGPILWGDCGSQQVDEEGLFPSSRI